MAQVPLMPDNSMLRMMIHVMDNPELDTPAASFFRRQLNGRPEFNIWAEHDQLREAARDALDADIAYRKLSEKLTWFRKLNIEFAKSVRAARELRDEKFEDYEFLRKLIATDNVSIALTKTK